MKPKRKNNAQPARPAVKSVPASPKNSGLRWEIPSLGIFLVVITFIVYGQTLHYRFINYDDDAYVYLNPTVMAGMTLQGLASAFGHYQNYNWIPLTMVSHMMDCQFYQLDAGQHHLTNVLLHTASAVILFLALRHMTGALWRSVFVAAVFAIHPLHVESVAWVAERKDVLSGFFFMLSLWAYAAYVRQPESVSRYLMVVVSFAAGLMSKSMLVTLPLVLLLLDYWPLGRFSQPVPAAGWSKNLSVPLRLVIEKIPLLLLSIACGIVTIFAQGDAIQSLAEYSLPVRLENSLIAYVIYAWQLFYPANLAIVYPYPANGFPMLEIAGALVVLAAISAAAFVYRKKCPFLLVGWLWYLVMLVPVIGLVQVGFQSRADRYTYLPLIGLSLLVSWLAVELGARLPHRRMILGLGATLVLAALIADARNQTAYWKDSESLWTHTIACTQNNSIAHNNLGLFLAKKGDVDDAIGQFQEAVKINPRYTGAFNNLGTFALVKGQLDDALSYYQKGLATEPQSALIENNLGLVYVQKGQLDQAIVHFQKSVDNDSNFADGVYDLRLALLKKAHADAASTNVPARVQ